jgi:anti-sigma factor RsiW
VTCIEIRHHLDAYVDRELDTGSTSAFSEHLRDCPECRRRLAERGALSQVLRCAPIYRTPERLRLRVLARASRVRRVRRLTMLATAALLLLSLGAGIAVFRSDAVRRDAVVTEVVDSHVRSLMADHLYDIESTDQHTVKPWFLGKLDFSPPVIDLAGRGFPLLGGRLDYLQGRPVAALVYERNRHTINVLVYPDDAPRVNAIEAYAVRGFHVRRWRAGGMSFWAVSDLNDGELLQLVHALQE